MPDQVFTRLKCRDICYEDWMGLVHVCRGYASRGRKPTYRALCNLEVAPDKVHPRARREAVTCPDCLALACEPARRVLAARTPARAAVGGLPFKPDQE
jgi:hypothetical protein